MSYLMYFLVATSTAAFPLVCVADEAPSPKISTVLVRFTMETPGMMTFRKPQITFENSLTTERFKFRTSPKLQKLGVAPGNYFIQDIYTGYGNPKYPIQKQEQRRFTIEIKPDSVTYIGDYWLRDGLELSITHKRESLAEAKRDTSLHEYPLWISSLGQPSISLTWN